MMRFFTLCAVLAPSAAAAAAFPWNGPQATLFAPAADVWSPAPTAAPAFGLFERQDVDNGNNTCGFVSGSSSLSITCPRKEDICATNTLLGAHGCCDPKKISSCILPTSCVPSSLMSASCSNKACSDDTLVTKCTNDAAPYCYAYTFLYTRTSMIQYGCGISEFTSTVLRTYAISSSISQDAVTVTVTQADNNSSAPADPTNTSTKSKSNTGAIAGGAVGGILGLAAIIFGVWFFLRKRKTNRQPPPATHHHHSMSQTSNFPPAAVTEYDPHGFDTTAYADNDRKGWITPQSPYQPPHSPMPQYPGQIQYGAVEISGITRVEIPG